MMMMMAEEEAETTVTVQWKSKNLFFFSAKVHRLSSTVVAERLDLRRTPAEMSNIVSRVLSS